MTASTLTQPGVFLLGGAAAGGTESTGRAAGVGAGSSPPPLGVKVGAPHAGQNGLLSPDRLQFEQICEAGDSTGILRLSARRSGLARGRARDTTISAASCRHRNKCEQRRTAVSCRQQRSAPGNVAGLLLSRERRSDRAPGAGTSLLRADPRGCPVGGPIRPSERRPHRPAIPLGGVSAGTPRIAPPTPGFPFAASPGGWTF